MPLLHQHSDSTWALCRRHRHRCPALNLPQQPARRRLRLRGAFETRDKGQVLLKTISVKVKSLIAAAQILNVKVSLKLAARPRSKLILPASNVGARRLRGAQGFQLLVDANELAPRLVQSVAVRLRA